MRSFYEASFGGLCEIGDKKPTNQDCILAKSALINGKNVGLFIVADGVGGLSNGDVISNIIALYFEKWFTKLEKYEINENSYSARLDEAIRVVNKMAFDYSESTGEKMGSTIALLMCVENRFILRNIGDSRIYRHNKEHRFKQLSKDHSLVAEMVRNGEICEDEARVHPRRNVLLSCMGVKPDVQSFALEGEINNNDIFILCSDGFYNYANLDKALSVLEEKKLSLDEIAAFMRRCIPRGNAKDNVSIILVKCKKRIKIF